MRVKNEVLSGERMERLTEKQSAGYDLKALNGEWRNHYCHKQRVETCNECGIYQAIQKLAYYEDLEEEIVEKLEKASWKSYSDVARRNLLWLDDAIKIVTNK